MTMQSSSILAHTGQLEATIVFTKPVKGINYDSIYFKVDSLRKVSLEATDLTYDPLRRKLSIRKTLDKSLFDSGEPNGRQRGLRPTLAVEAPPGEKKPTIINEFYLGRGAFMSIENDTSKQIAQKIKPMTQQDLSVINIEIRTEEKSFLVELVDNNYKVIRQAKNTPVVEFQNVVPGEYQLRLIIDKNGNGRWDPGNYFKYEEPEPIVYYRGTDGSTNIKGVKANWEVGKGEMFITY
jgi:hypothetical protein